MTSRPAGFEPATRCLQIRIYAVRQVSSRVNECHFVFGRRKVRADKYQQMLTCGQESGGILVVRPARSRSRENPHIGHDHGKLQGSLGRGPFEPLTPEALGGIGTLAGWSSRGGELLEGGQ